MYYFLLLLVGDFFLLFVNFLKKDGVGVCVCVGGGAGRGSDGGVILICPFNVGVFFFFPSLS